MIEKIEKKIIADTSIWIEYFKNNEEYVQFIEEYLQTENILITGLIISELLHGVKSEKEYLLLKKSIGAVQYTECIYEDWVKTGEILYCLKKEGITVPLTDALVAAISLRKGALVLTLDKHFKSIAQINMVNLSPRGVH